MNLLQYEPGAPAGLARIVLYPHGILLLVSGSRSGLRVCHHSPRIQHRRVRSHRSQARKVTSRPPRSRPGTRIQLRVRLDQHILDSGWKIQNQLLPASVVGQLAVDQFPFWN